MSWSDKALALIARRRRRRARKARNQEKARKARNEWKEQEQLRQIGGGTERWTDREAHIYTYMHVPVHAHTHTHMHAPYIFHWQDEAVNPVRCNKHQVIFLSLFCVYKYFH